MNRCASIIHYSTFMKTTHTEDTVLSHFHAQMSRQFRVDGNGHDSGELLSQKVKVKRVRDDNAQVQQDGDAVQSAKFAAHFVVFLDLFGFQRGHIELHHSDLMSVIRGFLIRLASPHDAGRRGAEVKSVH